MCTLHHHLHHQSHLFLKPQSASAVLGERERVELLLSTVAATPTKMFLEQILMVPRQHPRDLPMLRKLQLVLMGSLKI